MTIRITSSIASVSAAEVARDAVSQKYIIGMRLMMLGLEHALRTTIEANGQGKALAEFEDA